MCEATRDSDFVADVVTDIDTWHQAVNPQFELILEAAGLARWPVQPARANESVLTPSQWTARLVTNWEELLAAQAALATAWFMPSAWREPASSSGSIAARTAGVMNAGVRLWGAFASF